jgi:hypothetical protein
MSANNYVMLAKYVSGTLTVIETCNFNSKRTKGVCKYG